MGMLSDVIWNRPALSFPPIFWNKEGSQLIRAKKPKASCRYGFVDDTIRADAFGSECLFRLQGVCPNETWHLWSSNPNIVADSLTESIIPLQCKHTEPTQCSTAPALGVSKYIPNTTAKRTTHIFLVEKLISLKINEIIVAQSYITLS